MNNKLMVIGGYGQVGGYVTALLSQNGIAPVVAGRNRSAFETFLAKHPMDASFRLIDTTSIIKKDLDGIDTVIMCLEHNNESVLQLCIQCQINYIDITPSPSYLSSLSSYKTQICKSGITVVLGVGIAPGISNLLCKDAASQLDTITSIDTDLMLGVGESHGKNAIQWLLNVLTTPYTPVSSDGSMIYSFTQRTFPETKKRLYTNINLADASILKNHYPDACIHSWFAYDVNWVTRLMVWMQRNHLMSYLRSQRARSFGERQFALELKLAKALHIGTNQYLSRARVSGTKNGDSLTLTTSISGTENSQLTASVAAYLALNIKYFESGLHNTEDLITIHDIRSFLHNNHLDDTLVYEPVSKRSANNKSHR